MENKKHVYSYRCKLVRVVDADTSVVDIDLGFGVYLNNQYIRFFGIDTPESRTRNLEEKALGLAAKARAKELLPKKFIMNTYKDGKGKFGRILGRPILEDGRDVCEVLISEGHARPYYGGKKESWT